jgi:hypothetical protein
MSVKNSKLTIELKSTTPNGSANQKFDIDKHGGIRKGYR